MSKLLKVFLIASFAVASFSAKAVTVASWGGAYTESQQKAYADTYTIQAQFSLRTITVVWVK